MEIERCENCTYIAELAHNFRQGTGYEKSYCCTVFACAEQGGYVVEISRNDRCEVFLRRADNAAD